MAGTSWIGGKFARPFIVRHTLVAERLKIGDNVHEFPIEIDLEEYSFLTKINPRSLLMFGEANLISVSCCAHRKNKRKCTLLMETTSVNENNYHDNTAMFVRKDFCRSLLVLIRLGESPLQVQQLGSQQQQQYANNSIALDLTFMSVKPKYLLTTLRFDINRFSIKKTDGYSTVEGVFTFARKKSEAMVHAIKLHDSPYLKVVTVYKVRGARKTMMFKGESKEKGWFHLQSHWMLEQNDGLELVCSYNDNILSDLKSCDSHERGNVSSPFTTTTSCVECKIDMQVFLPTTEYYQLNASLPAEIRYHVSEEDFVFKPRSKNIDTFNESLINEEINEFMKDLNNGFNYQGVFIIIAALVSIVLFISCFVFCLNGGSVRKGSNNNSQRRKSGGLEKKNATMVDEETIPMVEANTKRTMIIIKKQTNNNSNKIENEDDALLSSEEQVRV